MWAECRVLEGVSTVRHDHLAVEAPKVARHPSESPGVEARFPSTGDIQCDIDWNIGRPAEHAHEDVSGVESSEFIDQRAGEDLSPSTDRGGDQMDHPHAAAGFSVDHVTGSDHHRDILLGGRGARPMN
jgi:hypothetical protein